MFDLVCLFCRKGIQFFVHLVQKVLSSLDQSNSLHKPQNTPVLKDAQVKNRGRVRSRTAYGSGLRAVHSRVNVARKLCAIDLQMTDVCKYAKLYIVLLSMYICFSQSMTVVVLFVVFA